MHTLPPLPYDLKALEPHIDAMTLDIHYHKHHAKYVENLNTALGEYPELQAKSLDELILSQKELPENIRTIVRNNAGGVWNHNFFWQIMSPQFDQQPADNLLEAITNTFGDHAAFQNRFSEQATKLFGSGWTWLLLNPQGELEIITTQNQDTPITGGHHPILGIDVWEHAYYLKYQNRRADYITAWWHVVNWAHVAELYLEAKKNN